MRTKLHFFTNKWTNKTKNRRKPSKYRTLEHSQLTTNCQAETLTRRVTTKFPPLYLSINNSNRISYTRTSIRPIRLVIVRGNFEQKRRVTVRVSVTHRSQTFASSARIITDYQSSPDTDHGSSSDTRPFFHTLCRACRSWCTDRSRFRPSAWICPRLRYSAGPSAQLNRSWWCSCSLRDGIRC